MMEEFNIKMDYTQDFTLECVKLMQIMLRTLTSFANPKLDLPGVRYKYCLCENFECVESIILLSTYTVCKNPYRSIYLLLYS